ncbi:Hint domain-containing protein [Stratiformator vulcanicus]|uniref:Uncharacterized protein n=1 Tax=Stratiformator vulcanicus TaxID=2527980 RepID=A0A517R5Y7_9PLAN|nr:Hint domain-containing protein [Stratiformator vulcanicus]QDT39255.1 hypothetical protein Pan189_36590 [Stratiformator vulcanicus]
MLAAGLAVQGLGFGIDFNTAPAAVPLAASATAPLSDARSRSIEELRLGHRVLGTNPETVAVDEIAEPDESWRAVSLQMRKETGDALKIELLRPLDWLTENGITVGETIHLDLPEQGAWGDAKVLNIGPCPAIEAGEGSVITGRFIHESSSPLLNVSIEGDEQPTGVTANHPFWSIDRNEFIAADDLNVGERVDTLSGIRRITSITPRGPPETVYNLEVHGQHVYRVGDAGVLVHNSCIQANKAAGDAVRDQIRNREAPALIEQYRRTVFGGRRIDVLTQGGVKRAYESKVGRTGLTKRVRRELAKDFRLLETGQVDEVIWEFARSGITGQVGPTAPLLAKLQKLGFKVIVNQ